MCEKCILNHISSIQQKLVICTISDHEEQPSVSANGYDEMHLLCLAVFTPNFN